jgi:adenosylmethionine-8-amino-7-oxononanoate aminotransferase
LEAVLEKDHGRLAALIVEPLVQAAAGMLVWPAGVLAKMRELTHKYQVLLIVDEVATGFGRTGKMFACEHEKISPDIMCLSKGLSAGYLPIACTLTTQDIYDAFVGPYPEKKTFFHGHSYTGNPLACAASLGSLEVFRKERVLEKLSAKILHLQKGLRQLSGLASVGDIRQLGFMVGIELVKDKASKAPYAWEERMGIRVCEEIRKKGIILRPLGNVIVLMPPLSIEKKEIDVLLEAAYEAIREVTS